MQIDHQSHPILERDKTLVLVYLGSKGSGKNLAADSTSQHLNLTPLASQLSFAEPLKEMLWGMFKQLIGEEKYLWGNDEEKSIPLENMPIDNMLKTKFPFLKGTYWSGRLLLQFYGTEIFRSTYKEVWLDKMKGSLEQAFRIGIPVISITDCRFPNEYDMLSKLDTNKFIVKFIRIDRHWKGERNDPHASESNWKHFKYDDLVFNDTSKEKFKSNVTQLVDKFLQE